MAGGGMLHRCLPPSVAYDHYEPDQQRAQADAAACCDECGEVGAGSACVAICGADAAYGAIGVPENVYAGWKSLEPWTEGEVWERFGVEPKGQVPLIVGLLSPANLLETLRDFVVFEPERGRLVKKLPRYQQFRAVHRAMERLLTHDKPEERGGVVWHTQGSGKSLTMMFMVREM